MFANKYQDDILGTNGSFDRVVVSGSIIPLSYIKGLSRFLSTHKILLKEFLSHARYLAELLKTEAKSLAEETNAAYIYLNDFETAQQLADELDVANLHALFDLWAEKYVSILPKLRQKWHLS